MIHRNVLILGASGECGKCAVRIALERGYQVTALVRPETSFEVSHDVRVIRGNVLDTNVINKAMEKQHAVLSCLGIKRKYPKNPWSSFMSPPDFMKQCAEGIVQAMERHLVKRLITISAAGVGDSDRRMKLMIRWMINYSNISIAYRDLAEMEQVYENSDIDWLVVRPVTLVNGTPSSRAQLVNSYGLFSTIARSEVARWMLDALERRKTFSNHYEMIGKN